MSAPSTNASPAALRSPAPLDAGWEFQSVPRIVLGHRPAVIAISALLAIVSAGIVLTNPPRIAVALFFSLVTGFSILLQPFLGLLAYYGLAFWRPQDLFWGLEGARLTYWVSLFTMAATMLHMAYRPNLRFFRQPQTWLVAFLWIAIYLSTEFGRFGTPEAKWMGYYNKLFLIYFVGLALLDSEKKVLTLTGVLAFCVAYLSGWANERHYLQGMAIVHGPGRPGSTLYDHNDFAMLIVMTVPIFWYFMRTARNRWVRLLFLLVLPLAAHAVFVTYSRGGFLGLVATMGYIMLREKNKKLVGAVAVLGVVFFALMAGEQYRERIGSIDDYREERSAAGRLEAWEVGMRMTAHNPIFGVGLRRYTDAFPYYSNWEPRVAHNSWVQLVAECGIPAVMCYGGLVLFTIWALWRVRRRIPDLPKESARLVSVLGPMLEAMLVGYLVCGFFLSMEDFEYFYLIVTLSQVLDRVTANRIRNREAEREGEGSEATGNLAGSAA